MKFRSSTSFLAASFFAALTLSLLVNEVSFASSGSSTGRITQIQWYEGHVGVLVVQENMSDLGG
jgi:hypothetical protein